jgi:hypothetical protein
VDHEDIHALAKRISRLERVVAELASRQNIDIPDLLEGAPQSGFASAGGASGFAGDAGASGFASDADGSGGSTGFASVDSATDPELLEMVRSGDMIRAIKRYRELTGAGLGEAKDAVEQMVSRNRALG